MKLNVLNNILIPEQLNGYYFLPQTVIGLEIAKQAINATKLEYAGSTITLLDTYHQPIELAENQQMRTVSALKKLAPSLGIYDHIRMSVPSSNLVIKKLTLPFSDRNKINNIIGYELESYLPFSLNQAVITFAIINTDQTSGESHIIATAAPRSLIEEYIAICNEAGLKKVSFSVDLFDLYSLYQIVPEYRNEKTPTIILDISAATTRILYINQGILENARTIPKGISWLGKELAANFSITPQEAIEKLLRFGFSDIHDAQYSSALLQIMQPYFSEIHFTLQSFAIDSSHAMRGLILGELSQVPQAVQFFSENLSFSCSNFSLESLFKSGLITLPNGTFYDSLDINSLSTALLTPVNQPCTFSLDSESTASLSLFKKQFLVGIGLISLTFFMLLIHSLREKSRLRNSALESENQIVKVLKQEGLASSKNANRAINEAHEKVASQEEIWFAFSKQTRISFLKYLERLSTAIDRVGLGLKLDKLAFTHRDNDLVLLLQGQVKNFDSLKILEQELKDSNLFIYVPSFQTKTFNEEIPLKKNGEDL